MPSKTTPPTPRRPPPHPCVLSHQTDKAAHHAAQAAHAELERALEDVRLATAVNEAATAHYGGLAAELAGWGDMVAAVADKRDRLRPLLCAFEGLEPRVSALEAAAASVEARSRALALRAGAAVDAPLPGGVHRGGVGGVFERLAGPLSLPQGDMLGGWRRG